MYIGGFLGPFGAGVLSVLIPQIREAFDTTTAHVALAIPAYLIPFAVLQLVSGTVGEQFGRRRAVRAGYLAYAVVSLCAAVAPTIGAFLVCRAAQGVANAFITPLLLAGLAEVVDPRRLGRSVGTFAAVQTAAIVMAPLTGGLLGTVDWRLVFVVPAAVAAALAFVVPDEGSRVRAGGRPRLRAVATREVALLCGAGFTGFAGLAGLSFIVALRLEDAFGLDSVGRGVVLAGFGVSGMLFGRAAGAAADRFGRITVAVAGALVSAGVVSLVGFAGSAGATAALWFCLGATSTLLWAGLNTLVVEAVPENRAGTTSVFGAFKFAGSAAAPIMFLPLYDADPRAAFLVAGVAGLAAAGFTYAFGVSTARSTRAAPSP
ncbi:MAG TPA: MFS transporter [Solirubrobacteraceae bacterium]|nr:MFS transporter [Solirubrobacteraceae bacterium]